MEAHKKHFVFNWDEFIRKCEANGKFDNLHKPFEIITIEFPFIVGNCNLIQTKPNDDIVYAKRIGREIYTRFIRNAKAETTNSIIFILNRSKNRIGEYYLITMFPGKQNFKEPEDINISSKEELLDCLKFWRDHALVYDESIIDVNSIKRYCPYKNLYIAVA
ncbi:hypothetical protein [Clostridium sp.]|uniref:hypothetical protein n=1 Tax=Clostridium sp. TaxID=1506 RepID=UPI002FC5B790